MTVKTDFRTQVNQLKAFVNENRFDLTLPIVLEIVGELKERRSIACIKEILDSVRDEDIIYLLRALDAGLMNHYSNFLIRYKHKKTPTALTRIFKSYEMDADRKVVEAEENIKQLIAEEGDLLDNKTLKYAYNAITNLLIDMKRFREAKEYLAKHEELSDESFYDRWGYYYFHAGEWDKAEECLLKGMEEDKKPQFCYLTLQSLYTVQGKFSEALEIIEQGIRAVPFFLPLYLEKANKLKQLNKWEDFLETAKEIDEKSPYHVYQHYFHYSRGKYLYLHSDFASFKSFVTEHPAVFHDSPYSKCESNSPGLIRNFPSSIVVQKYNYCVPATVSMLLSRYNITRTQDEISRHIYDINGSSIFATVQYLESIGMACRYFFGSVPIYKQLTDEGVSVIISVDYPNGAHVQLLRGYDDNLQALYIQDPNTTEMQTVSFEDFEKYYCNNQYQSIAIAPAEEKKKLDQLDPHEHAIVQDALDYLEKLENEDSSIKQEFYDFVKANSDCVYVIACAIKVFHLEEQTDLLASSIEKVIEIHPDSDYFKLISAHAFVKVNKYEEAKQLLEGVKSKDTHLYSYILGRIAIDHDQYSEAIGHFREALNNEPDHYNTWSYLALCHLYDGDIETAFKYSEISLDINSEDYWNRINHGRILFDQEKYTQARDLFTQIIKDFKHLPPAWYERARCDRAMDKLRHALRGFAVAKRLAPEIAHPYREIASIHAYHYNDLDEAIKQVKAGLDQARGDYSLLMHLGDFYEEQANLLEAKKCYEEAMQHHPDEPYPPLALAKVKHELNEQEEAIALLKEQKEKFSADSYFLINAGKWLFQIHEDQDHQQLALDWLEAGLSLEGDNHEEGWDLYVSLIEYTDFNQRGRAFLQKELDTKYADNIDLICYIGCLYERANQLDTAVTYYKTALKIENHTFPLYRLGEVALQRNHLAEAKNFYQSIIEIDKTFASAYSRLAEIANRKEDIEAEQANLFMLLKHNPYEVNVSHLADISRQIGKIKKVVSTLTFMKGEVEEAWRLYALAHCAGAQEKIELEEKYLTLALAIEPDHFSLLASYSTLKLKQGNYHEAISLLLDLIVRDVEYRDLYTNFIYACVASNNVANIAVLLDGAQVTNQEKSLMYMYAAYEVEQHLLELKNSSWLNKLKHMKQIKMFERKMIELYKGSYSLDTNNDKTLIWLYEYYSSQGQMEKSMAEAARFLAKKWSFDMALYYAQLLVNKHIEEEFPDKGDELQKAEKLLQDCLDEQPGNAIAHYFLGKLYNDLNLLHKAEFHLEKALKADSKDYEFYYESSLVYEKLEQFEKAEEFARISIQLQPQFLLGYNQVSVLCHRQGKTAEALAVIDELLEMEEGFLMAHYNKACYLSVLGYDALEAFGHLKFAVKNMGNDYFRNLASSDPDLDWLRMNSFTAKKMKQLLK
ncbi:tetratricopeptide repeat protein [Bacillus sp. V3-13]|uniref:tetratricopeptide repeat protein n=1 Tax=Bacillus sp. V3-13 TaxID=2053728 RepID=UPI0015E133C3|nr:tetratricopeptide repeat protein [Bacillus sp. V3-13]